MFLQQGQAVPWSASSSSTLWLHDCVLAAAAPSPHSLTRLHLCLHQVRLTEDLALSTSRQSQLQLEASSHQQKAMELQNKLSSALQSGESQSQCIASLEAQLQGLCCCL